MSLIKCHECQKDISSGAAVCPHCGAGKKKSKAGLLIVVALGVGFLVMIGAGGSSGDSMDAPQVEANKPKLVPAKVAYTDSAIVITRTGNQPWDEAVLYINGTPPDGFKARVVPPSDGQTISIPLASFTKKSGERFNIHTHALKQVWIGGGGYDFKNYTVEN